MADLSTLRKFESLGPFEIKNELIALAKETSRTTQSSFLNAGRGNPNWIATEPREAFFLLGQFAITESKRVMDLPPGIGGMPQANGIASRLDAWLAKHGDMPGASFLSSMVAFAIAKFSFDRDAFVHELVELDHRRQLPGAGPHARAQRADRARISDVGDVRRRRARPASSTSTRSRAARPRCATSSSR